MSRTKRTHAQYDQKVHFYEPPNTIQNSTERHLCETGADLLLRRAIGRCAVEGRPYWRARGNYVINWGQIAMANCRNDRSAALPGVQSARCELGAKFGLPPFGFKDLVSPYCRKQTSFKDFTDGTSHTMLHVGSDSGRATTNEFDIRGDMLNDDTPCTMYMTINTPNSGTDVSVVSAAGAQIPRIRRTRTSVPPTRTNRPAAGTRAA